MPESPKEPSPPAPPDEPRPSQPVTGWIASLRARLGLTGPQTLRQTLEDALRREAATADAFKPAEREMLLRLLRFGALRVDDVMVPRADIIAIDESEPLSELVNLFKEAGVSRIPVFHETLDDPRGIVHIKDLLRALTAEAAGSRPSPAPAEKPATGTFQPTTATAVASRAAGVRGELSRPIASAKLLRQVIYVPPSMPALNLLLRMQSTRQHMALVVDEYGGTDGLVTIEDLVEQVVGDIEDEHDVAEAAHISEDPQIGLIADARTPVAELEARLGMRLLEGDEADEIDTLGGLVFSVVGRVPARGEVVRHRSGIEFEVLDADPRRVKKLKILLQKPADGPPPTS
jgi:CBS domain containing-hemolysin-like protein